MNVEREIDALYAGPPEAFVTGRDALAKQLKDDGRPEESAAVKSLRRPTAAAWALNRLAHGTKDGFASLEELARDLRKAQRGALSGLRGTALREAVKRRRSVVDALADAAVQGLEAEGRGGEGQREAITRTLEAAAADPDALDALRAGRLEKELQRPTGFGDLAGLTGLSAVPDAGDDQEVSTEPAARPKRGGAKDRAAARPSAEEARLLKLRTQRDEAADDSRSAAQAAVRAGERAVQASEEAESAATEIERMERDLRAARRRHRDATESATQAAASAKKAEAEAERARKKVEDLQARIEKLLEG